jgi:hypothetical protein
MFCYEASSLVRPALASPLPRGVHRSGGLTMTSSYRAPKFTTHSASSNLHTSVSIAHRYTHLPRYNLDKISIFRAQHRTHAGGHDSS